jgi:hypothetical protein
VGDKETTEQVPDDLILLDGIGLNFEEAALLCDALRSVWLSPQFIERMWRTMSDVIRRERLDEKWGCDAEALTRRLSKLRRVEATALLRGAIRFWERREKPTAKLLSELGMTRRRRRKEPNPANGKRTSKRPAMAPPAG